jgi:hypothetical protein
MGKLKLLLGGLILILLGLGVYFLVGFIRHVGESRYVYRASSETVIKEIRSLNRLETASFTIEKVIDAGTGGGSLQQFLFGDRLLLIAHGSVIAGFDLAKIQETDVQVEDTTLRLTLPPPQILVTTLDPKETRVYDRRTGLLNKGDKDLETEARTEAENIITQAACTGGILQEAEKNARNQLSVLFKGLGFTTVVFTIPQGVC